MRENIGTSPHLLHQQVADRPAQRPRKRQGQSECRQVRANCQPHQHQPGRSQDHARTLARGGPFAKQQGGKQHGQEDVGLLRHRSEAGRHPMPEGEEQEQELAGEQRQPDQHKQVPRYGWAGDEEYGRCGNQETQRGELGRREAFQAEPGCHERQPPNYGGECGKGCVAGRHGPRRDDSFF